MLSFYLILGVLGLAVGSFIGMLTWRLPRGLLITGRSFCDKCRKIISFWQNIPVVSWFLLGGKCKYCHKRISARYPVIELATAVVFVATGYFLQTTQGGAINLLRETLGFLFFPAVFVIVTIFIVLAVIDAESQILPDVLIIFVGAIVLLALFFSPSPTLFTHLFWGIISFSFFLLLYLVTKGRGMGFGDVKLAFVLGALLGYPALFVWLGVAFLTGAAVGVFLLSIGRAKLGAQIAFGPFLLFGALVAMFWGDKVWKWYTNFL